MAFPIEALRGRHLSDLELHDAYFEPTSLFETRLHNCRFIHCRFERLEVSADTRVDATLQDCSCGSLLRLERDDQLFDPGQILSALQHYGFRVVSTQGAEVPTDEPEPDDEIVLLQRVLRMFLRGTQLNESFLRTKLGSRGTHFVDHVLPEELIRAGVLEEVGYKGAGTDRRYKIRVPMTAIQEALTKSRGDFAEFLAAISAR
jgi:hypothetical protein